LQRISFPKVHGVVTGQFTKEEITKERTWKVVGQGMRMRLPLYESFTSLPEDFVALMEDAVLGMTN